MAKITPNPPTADEHMSRAQSARNKKLDEAAERALDFYLKPTPKKETSDNPNSIFRIAPDVDSECLLASLWGFHDHPDSHSTNIRTLIPR